MIEALESRRLLSAVIVNGTEGDDTILLYTAPFNTFLFYYATVNGQSNPVCPVGNDVEIDAGIGNDQITIATVQDQDAVSVIGSDGNDTLYVGVGNASHSIRGFIYPSLGIGANKVIVDDSSNTGSHDPIALDDSVEFNYTSDTDFGEVNLFSASATSTINLSDGNDALAVDIPITGATINLGGGINTVRYAQYFEPGLPLFVLNPMTLNGGVNTDTAVFDDTGDTSGNGLGYQFDAHSALRQTLVNFENVEIDTGPASFAHPNSISISGIPINSFGAVNVNGGANNVDNVDMDVSSANVFGTLNLNDTGQHNFDVALGGPCHLDKLNSSGGEEISFEVGGVTNFTTKLLHPGLLSMQLGSADDLVYVDDVPSSTVLSLNTGGGDDTIVAGDNESLEGNILGSFSIDGGNGSDTVFLNDAAGVTGVGHTDYDVEPFGLTKGGRLLVQWVALTTELIALSTAVQNNNVYFHLSRNQEAQLAGNSGNDTFYNRGASQLSGSLINNAHYALILGGGGNDTFVMDDTADQLVGTYQVGEVTSFVEAGFPSIGGSLECDPTVENITLTENNADTSTTFSNYKQASTKFTVNGGAGNSAFSFPFLFPTFTGYWINTTVNGGGGNDSIRFSDNADPGNGSQPVNYSFYLNNFTKDSGSDFDVDYFGFESETLLTSNESSAPSRADNVGVYALPAGMNLSIIGGVIVDHVIMGLGDVDDIDSTSSNPMSVLLGPEDDLTVNDYFNTDDRAYSISGSTVSDSTTGFLMTYQGAGGVVLNCSDGNDTISVPSDSAPITVNGNAGNDIATLGTGNIAANLPWPVTVLGAAGANTVIYDDSSDASAASQILSATGFTTSGVTYPYSSATNLTVLAGPGGDSLAVNAVAAATGFVHFTGGIGDDAVNIGAGDLDDDLLANVTVNGNAGTDTVAVNDSLSAAGGTYTYNAGTFRKGNLGKTVTVSGIEGDTLLTGRFDDAVAVSGVTYPLEILSSSGNDSITANTSSDVSFNTGLETAGFGAFGDTISVNPGGSGAAVMTLFHSDAVASVSTAVGGRLVVGSNFVLINTHDLTNTGVIDLSGGTLIVNGAASQVSAYQTWLKAGYANGAWNGTSIVLNKVVTPGAINSALAAQDHTHFAVGFAPHPRSSAPSPRASPASPSPALRCWCATRQ